ncbi:hypothetical protein G5B30_08340 [Sphingobacterium sp. SGG-5]|uniref:hypothetical protein n=1 Tax=Sphingobacterium sp. SGG-5 TaxID=2710881 RepID=UPI0013EE2588|nr:hypothetical protein [Sphingobacterium sp. SGG-5]NGM61923.1 hypothetical protein [Sphingobacterium sp. SGG-5]
MKKINFNKMVAFIAVIALAAGVFLYAEAKNRPEAVKKVAAEGTWYFQGGNPEDPDSYSDEPVEDKPCGAFEETICQITAPDSLGKPQMSAAVPGTSPSQTVGEQIAAAAANPHTNETVLSLREE